MPRATKKDAETAAEVKEVKAAAPAEEKKTAAKKSTTAKKTAATAKKSTAAKKTTAAKKPTAAKTVEESKVVIQANGSEVNAADLVEKAKAAAGIKTAKKVDVYVKPEVNKVYYVINGEIFGDFDLF